MSAPTFGSLFAGIGGFDCGIERAGGTVVYQCEQDKQCQSVLRRHFPDCEIGDDVADGRTADVIRGLGVDGICGGFPCQDISVAGKRAGLAGERSGLWFAFRDVIAEVAPRWVLIENVAGLLSSNGGRDMGTILGQLGQLGYGWAYRVLDSQWFGVAQRRRRVFIVGCLGDARRAGQVLFESESVPWDSPPSREAGKGVTGGVAASLNSGGNNGGFRTEPGEHLIAAHDTGQGWWNQSDVSGTLRAEGENRPSRPSNVIAYRTSGNCGVMEQGDRTAALNCGTDPCQNIITHALTAEGHDASEDGTGRGTPIIPIDMRQASRGERMTNNRPGGSSGGPPGTGIGRAGDPSPTLSESHAPAIAFQERGRDDGRSIEHQEELSYALRAIDGGGCGDWFRVSHEMRVRRLTPRECERLQGFPDDWTRYSQDGREISDSARYRMLGNAVTVNVAEWIGRRIVSAAEPPRVTPRNPSAIEVRA